MIHLLLQDTWITVMYPVTNFIMATRQDGLKAVQRVEDVVTSGRHPMSPYSWKRLESLRVGEDFKELARKLNDPDLQPTIAVVNQVADGIIRHRWWSWILLHPDMPDSTIHPSRRMFCLSAVSLAPFFLLSVH